MTKWKHQGLWSLVALLLVAATGAQEPQASQEEPSEEAVFGETIVVKVVNVDVYVTDKQGNPVTGLAADDFELYEEKKPIKITNFYEFQGGQAVAPEDETRTAEREEEAPRPRSREELFTSHPGLERSDVPEDQRLSLVVYVDQQNITPINRNRLFRYLRQFLRTKLDRDDRVMLVNYNRSLKVVRPFTSDSELIADATYELEKHTGGRSIQRSERVDLLREIDEGRDYQISLGRARLYAESVYNDLQFTLDGLRMMVEQLAGVPGRKAILYVSDGLPMRAGEDIFWALDERFRGETQRASEAIMQTFHYDASRRFNDIARLANANRVTFYTIDAAGLRVGGLRSAEYGTIGLSTNIESIYTRNLQDTLMYLADKTGGRAIVNTNNFLDGLDRIATDFENYYSLGFSPSHAGTGRRYDLEVKIKKEVMKERNIKEVRFRDSYQDKPVAQEMGDATLASLSFGFQSNPLGVRLVPEDRILRDDGTYMVRIAIQVPVASLQLVPVEGDYQARLRLWVQAMDTKGRLSSVQEQVWNVSLSGADIESAKRDDGYVTYVLPLIMRSGDQRVAVAVRDELSAEASYVSRVLSLA